VNAEINQLFEKRMMADSSDENKLSIFRQQVDTLLQRLSLWLIGTVRAEPETVISRAWVQSPDPAE